ncbi:hypothetical protein JTB14_009618 [Gonioctena quinquepunctata]|nr:hypothetical protein JTB14_009618 [Gonioctena quinquepunctata]
MVKSTCFLCESVQGKAYHRISMKPSMKSIWMRICNLEPWEDVSMIRICSDHFRPEDYAGLDPHTHPSDSKGFCYRLKKNAVPSLKLESTPLLPRYVTNTEVTPARLGIPVIFEDNAGAPRSSSSIYERKNQKLCEHCGIFFFGPSHPKRLCFNGELSDLENLSESLPNLHHCNVCGSVFSSEEFLIQHEKTHAAKQAYNRKWIFKKRAGKVYKVQRKRGLFKCDSCSKMFLKKSDLKIHRKSHVSEEESFYSKIFFKKFVPKGVS